MTLLLSRLAINYWRPDFTEGQSRLLIQDMLDDLSDYRVQEIEVAVRKWRIDATKKFFPRGAELIELIREDRKDRREIGDGKRAIPEFGDSRPFGWEYQRKKFWEPHWRADDLDRATDPDRRKRYDAWLAKVKSGTVEGKNADEY